MTLTPGIKLGPYEIVAPLGAGGMGEVYRARDTRLGRDVAVKVLPAAYASDPERRARFESEARAVAALSHPNILALHDIGVEAQTAYVVMELLDGETLRERLVGGPLAAARAIAIAIPIARGLAAAHDRGIIHRDLKPENVMLTADGFVKLLDFGLARRALVEGSASHSVAPTVAASTEPGTVLGTTGDMAPEQVRGLIADARSDLFAFGAVLFEMIAGRRAFSGDSPADVMTAILREDTSDLAALVPGTPQAVARIVARCLEKNPAARFRSAADLAFALEAIATSSSSASASGAHAVVASVSTPRFKRLTYRHGNVTAARFVPGGSEILFAAAWQGSPIEIFAARAGIPDARGLGLPAANLFDVSVAGELAIGVGFHHTYWNMAFGQLARVALGSLGVRALQKDVGGAAWSPDGRTMAVVRFVEGRCRLEYPSGQTIFETTGFFSEVRVAADGRRVAFAHHSFPGDSAGDVCLWEGSGAPRVLFKGMTSLSGIAWSANQEEIWFSGVSPEQYNGIWAVRPDGSTRTLQTSALRMALHDVAPDGRALVSLAVHRFGMFAGRADSDHVSELSWYDGSNPTAFLPDGRHLLFWEGLEAANPEYATFIRALDGSPAVRLGTGLAIAVSPDGQWVLSILMNSDEGLELQPVGMGEPRRIRPQGFRRVELARFRPGRATVLIAGELEDGRTRLAELDLETAATRIVWDEDIRIGLEGLPLTSDGERMVIRRPSREYVLLTLADGSLSAIPGLLATDNAIRFGEGDRVLYVAARAEASTRIDRIELATGARTPWRAITLTDSTGVLYVGDPVVSDDEQQYAYACWRRISDLYLMENLG